MNNNFCVIMAGGVGSRFWPFSTNDRPKQFLDFFGVGKTLIQLTFDRFARIVPKENIYIVTNALYRDLTMEQLPEITSDQVLLEPMRRNTAPCIAYAIYKIRQKNEDANIVVAPSDHLILMEDEFVRTINQGLDFVSKEPSLLTLGMMPTRPETGYGYIQAVSGDSNLRKVKTFTEKPNIEIAKAFIQSGEFYWNSGMFLFNMKTVLAVFEEKLFEVASIFDSISDAYFTEKEQDAINEVYPQCPNVSFDIGIMEKAQNAHVLISDFGWSDLGTWSSLYDLSDKDENRNSTLRCNSQFYDSSGNLVVLPTGKLAVIQGLEGYLVAEEDDVLLICPKDEESKMRQIVNDVNEKFSGKYI